MKTAIYIEDGIVQLVLTPENKFESNALRSFEDKSVTCAVKPGQFYEDDKGRIRQEGFSGFTEGVVYGLAEESERSLFVRADFSSDEAV